MGSWRTTAAGVTGALFIVFGELRDLLDNDPSTVFEIALIGAAISTLVGLFAAKDHKVE